MNNKAAIKGLVPRVFISIPLLHQSASSGHLIHWLQAFLDCLKILRAIQILEFLPVESHNTEKKFVM
jgi:hypothetical protein